jgi:hypothetical protein
VLLSADCDLAADAPEVLIELRNGRKIMVRLVGIAPSNTQWKKDLAWFHHQIARLKGQTQEAGRN